MTSRVRASAAPRCSLARGPSPQNASERASERGGVIGGDGRSHRTGVACGRPAGARWDRPPSPARSPRPPNRRRRRAGVPRPREPRDGAAGRGRRDRRARRALDGADGRREPSGEGAVRVFCQVMRRRRGPVGPRRARERKRPSAPRELRRRRDTEQAHRALERIYGRRERRDIEFVATNRAPSVQRWLSSAWLSVQVNKPPPTRPSPLGDSTGDFDRGRLCVRARTRVPAARSAGGFSASSPRSRSPAASPTRARMAGRAQSAASRGGGEERPQWRHAHVRYWMLRRPASRPAVLETVRPPNRRVLPQPLDSRRRTALRSFRSRRYALGFPGTLSSENDSRRDASFGIPRWFLKIASGI